MHNRGFVRTCANPRKPLPRLGCRLSLVRVISCRLRTSRGLSADSGCRSGPIRHHDRVPVAVRIQGRAGMTNRMLVREGLGSTDLGQVQATPCRSTSCSANRATGTRSRSAAARISATAAERAARQAGRQAVERSEAILFCWSPSRATRFTALLPSVWANGCSLVG